MLIDNIWIILIDHIGTHLSVIWNNGDDDNNNNNYYLYYDYYFYYN